MTTNADAPRTEAAIDWREAAILAAFGAVFFLSRPYQGVVGDSVLYIGRAVAALDPGGVGQDPMWLLDGQMRYSLFPFVVRALVAILGAPDAAMTLAFSGLALWVAALFSLVLALGERRSLFAVTLACAAFPAAYGAYGNIYFGEPLALPRVFAEAASLAALAAVTRGASITFALLSVVAFVLHPIMAAGAVACGFVILCWRDRRWVFAGALVGTAILGGAILGAPLLGRLKAPIDPEWLSILRGPSEIVFPTEWPASAWILRIVQAASALLCACMSVGAMRRLLVAVLVVSAGSLAASLIFADIYPLQLVAQAQLWRANWLLAVAGPLSFAIIAPRLWREGGASRIAASLLVGAWAVHDSAVAPVLAVAAFGARFPLREAVERTSGRINRLLVYAGPTLVGVTALIELIGLFVQPSDGSPRAPLFVQFLDMRGFAGPAALAIALGLASFRPRLPRVWGAVIAAAICLASLAMWRLEWDPYRRAVARSGLQADLVEKLSRRPGPVLWLGGNQEAWYWAGRPNWAAGVQGNGIVFSRDLAINWRDRMSVIRDLGWITDGGLVSRRLSRPDPIYPDISPLKTRAFCERPDAPAWIVAPVPESRDGALREIWRAPAQRYAASPEGGRTEAIALYVLIACHEASSP